MEQEFDVRILSSLETNNFTSKLKHGVTHKKFDSLDSFEISSVAFWSSFIAVLLPRISMDIYHYYPH